MKPPSPFISYKDDITRISGIMIFLLSTAKVAIAKKVAIAADKVTVSVGN